MKRLILLDGNNWGFSGSATKPLFSGTRQVQAIYYVINRVREVIAENPEAKFMVLWDGRSWRHSIHSEYKGTRENTEAQRLAKENYLQQKPDIILALRLLGIPQITASNMEADDLAEMLTKSALSKNTPVTLLTADHDWQQLVVRGVTWLNLIHNQSCRYSSFKRDTGYSNPQQFVEAKCIIGDVGDNVKGLKGVGPKALEGVYSAFASFSFFLNAMERERDITIQYWQRKHGKTMPKALREIDVEAARELLKFNHVMMDLATEARPKPIGLKKDVTPLDATAFLELCNRNAFRNIVANMEEFLQPFIDNASINSN